MIRPNPTPLFLQGTRGRLFATFYECGQPPVADRTAVLFLPPFAEEMNRSRRITADLGMALARAGVDFLTLDLYGTGDSEGDFSEARWSIWRQDAITGLDWLYNRGQQNISIVGLRLGACLALDAASTWTHSPSGVVLWQPVANGAALINQFLRVRVAGGMGDGPAGMNETTKSLRARLNAGERLEIGGYEFAPELAAEIDNVRLSQQGRLLNWRIAILECAGEANTELSPATQSAISEWRQSGAEVGAEIVAGAPFWAIEETAIGTPLIEATVEALASASE